MNLISCDTTKVVTKITVPEYMAIPDKPVLEKTTELMTTDEEYAVAVTNLSRLVAYIAILRDNYIPYMKFYYMSVIQIITQ